MLLIAGDLFHRQPLLRELKELNSMFEALDPYEGCLYCRESRLSETEFHVRNFRWAGNVTPLLGARLMK